MTRGDAHKIGEWVDYHARLGFGDFQIVLDGEVDDTEAVLKSLDVPATITVHRRPEIGEYADGLSAAQRKQQAAEWRQRHAAELEAGRIRGHDPLSWRQHQHFPEILAPYAEGERGRGWLALIDVDEFIVLRGYPSVRQVTHQPGAPRLRLLSFNVDTTGHDPGRPVLEQHTRRWSREDLLALDDQRWANRPKSIVRYRCARLTSTVHKISTGRQARPRSRAGPRAPFPDPAAGGRGHPVRRGGPDRHAAAGETARGRAVTPRRGPGSSGRRASGLGPCARLSAAPGPGLAVDPPVSGDRI